MLNAIAGRIARVASRSTCRLTHYGRTTGRPHQVTIWFLPDGDHIYLSTMNMQRHWTRNVQANPRVVLQIGDERLEGTARQVTGADEMAHVARLMKRKYLLSRPYLWIKKRPDGAFRVDLDATPQGPVDTLTGRILVVVLVALLAACTERAPAPGPVTLVFKHSRIFGPVDPIPALLREFEAMHPGVRVRSETLPAASDEQHQFYVVNLEGRSTGFDVMMLDLIWVPEFARAGWLLDLTARVSADELGAFFSSAVHAGSYAGRVWALPWNMNVGFLYYRADLLARYGLEPPATWDELVAHVRRVREGERDVRLDGYLWQGKQYEGLVCNVLEAFWSHGTDLLGGDGHLLPDAAKAADALAFLRGLIDSGVSPRWTTAADEEMSRRAFGDGRAVFLRNWPYVLDLLEAADSPVRGRVGIAPLPGLTRDTRGLGATGGAHLGVARASRHPEEAVALARFLTSERAQRAIIAGTLYPARTALYHDAELVRRHPALPRIHTLMLAGRPRPVTPNYLLLSTTLQPEFSKVLVGLRAPGPALADARRRLEYFLASRR